MRSVVLRFLFVVELPLLHNFRIGHFEWPLWVRSGRLKQLGANV